MSITHGYNILCSAKTVILLHQNDSLLAAAIKYSSLLTLGPSGICSIYSFLIVLHCYLPITKNSSAATGYWLWMHTLASPLSCVAA